MKKDPSYPKGTSSAYHEGTSSAYHEGTSSAYPKHALGEHIVPFQLTFHKDETVKNSLSFIRQNVGSWPNTENIYVVEKNNKLIGSVEFKKLISAQPKVKLYDLMEKAVALTDHSHQGTAIKIAIKKDIESIPITDQNGHFLGIIDAGQIFKIMHEEHIERLMHFSGILNDESLAHPYSSKTLKVVKARLPWLILGLLGGLLVTSIVKGFSHTLEAQLALAFFIPIIVYMNAAVGAQTQTIFVRYSALEKVGLARSLLYEVKVAVLMGVVLSLGIFLFTFLWLKDANLSRIVGFSMFCGILSSAFIGTIVPWLLQKTGRDPAFGSGPFATITQDLLSIIIYFSIASALL